NHPVWNDFRQATHVGDQHGSSKVVGDLRHSALRRGAVGLRHDGGRGEIVLHLRFRDVRVAENDAVGYAQIVEYLEVRLLVVVKLPRDQQFHVVQVAQFPTCESLGEKVQTF